jgi:hypothetical protein
MATLSLFETSLICFRDASIRLGDYLHAWSQTLSADVGGRVPYAHIRIQCFRPAEDRIIGRVFADAHLLQVVIRLEGLPGNIAGGLYGAKMVQGAGSHA